MGGGDGLVLDQALHYSTAGTVGISYRRLRRECGDLRIQFGQLCIWMVGEPPENPREEPPGYVPGIRGLIGTKPPRADRGPRPVRASWRVLLGRWPRPWPTQVAA